MFWLQLVSLIVSIFTLVFLVAYVYYTKQIAEATNKPAVIAVQGASIDATPHFRNIGHGPALDVEWEIPNSGIRGKVACIEAGKDSEPLASFPLDRTLVDAAMKANANRLLLLTKCRSISGNVYSSENEYDLDRGRFSTTFKKNALFLS